MFRLSSLTGAADDPSLAVPRDGAETQRLALLSLYGIARGVFGAVVAWLLYHLIIIVTGLAFYRTLTTRSPLYPPAHGLGMLAIIIPVVGGLFVGVMAKYGSERRHLFTFFARRRSVGRALGADGAEAASARPGSDERLAVSIVPEREAPETALSEHTLDTLALPGEGIGPRDTVAGGAASQQAVDGSVGERRGA